MAILLLITIYGHITLDSTPAGPLRSLAIRPAGGHTIEIYRIPSAPVTATLAETAGKTSIKLLWSVGDNGGSALLGWIVYMKAAQGDWDQGVAVALGGDIGVSTASYTYSGLIEPHVNPILTPI